MDAAYNTFKKTALFFAIALLAAAPSFAQQIAASPSSVTLSTNQPVSLSITASAAVNFTVSQDQTFFLVNNKTSGVSGTTDATLSVQIFNTNCGACLGHITIHPTSGGGTDVVVQVTYSPSSGGGNVISIVSPVTLNTFNGGNTFEDVAVNSGSVSVTTYSVSSPTTTDGNPWLSVNLTPGYTNQVSLGSPSSLRVTVNAAGLQDGAYSGSFTVTPLGGTGTLVQVVLTVGGGSNSNFSPPSLTFDAALNSAQQSKSVLVSGASNPVPAQNCQGWLGAGRDNNNVDTYIITVFPTALSTAGVYTCNVDFGAPGSLPVTLNLGTGGGGGGGTTGTMVAPSSLNFTYQVGGNPPPTQLVTVAGTGSYTYTTVGSPSFISANGSGTAPGTIAVSTIASLPIGQYHGTLVITTSSGTQNVSVNLTVSGLPAVNANPGSFNITWQPGDPNTVSNLNIFASDASEIPITVSSSASWVTVAGLTSTTTPAAAQVTIDPTGLPNGLNSATITVTPTGAGNTTLTIPVVALVSGSSGTSGNLTLSAQSMSFFGVVSGSAPAPQTLTVSSSPAGVTFSATKSGTNCGWLTLNPSGGGLVTPRTLTVSANQAGLTANTYQCSISLNSGGNTQTVNVTFVVSTSGGGASGNVTVSPASLTFTYTQGDEPPGVQGVVVSSASSAAGVGFTTSVTSGNTWLSVSPTQAQTKVTMTVSVSPVGLAPNTYTGNIRISPNGGAPIDVPVTLVVQSLTVSASPTSLTFSYRAGDPAPAAQTVSVTGGTGLTFSATPTSSGWLKVTPTTGTTPANLSVTIDPAGLTTSGAVHGSITVMGTGTATGSTTVDVTVNVTAPLPTITGVTNGASFATANTISAGEVITIFGTNIGPSTPAGLTLDSNGNVSTSIGGVQVLVNGFPSPMIYASGTQVSAVVPYEIANPFRVNPNIQVKYLGQTSNGVQVTQVGSAPGLFTYNSSGSGPGAILNSNNSVNSPTNPANKGDTVVLYVTGEGQTTPAGVTGKVTTVNPAGNPLTPQPLLPVAVRIDGQPAAAVPFYGEAPGIVSGVMQVNVQIPATARSGNLSVEVQVGSNSSQTGVTVSVK